MLNMGERQEEAAVPMPREQRQEAGVYSYRLSVISIRILEILMKRCWLLVIRIADCLLLLPPAAGYGLPITDN
jgi:hypothetical protein